MLLETRLYHYGREHRVFQYESIALRRSRKKDKNNNCSFRTNNKGDFRWNETILSKSIKNKQAQTTETGERVFFQKTY